MRSSAAVDVIDSSTNYCEPDLDDPGGSKPRFTMDWGVKEDQWENWHWQLKNSIRTVEELKSLLPELDISDKTIEASKCFPMAITPYYLSLIKKFDYSDPIFSQSVPNEQELNNPCFLSDDPLAEEHDTVINNLVHRYNDRALVISTSKCAMYCRHCTRKRVAGTKYYNLSNKQLDNIIIYLNNHPEIKDVIISGGDAFTMSTSKLENILKKLRSVETLDIIRIGTRTPVTLPMRITDDLVNMIAKYHPIWVNTHFNHPNEITKSSKKACEMMANKGIPVNNQCVLLKGINDSSNTMIDLCRGLLKIRVKPYYIFQCDLVKGVEHFRTPISKGIEIMENLRGRISGLGIPSFIIDAPEGKGKIPILPNYILMRENDQTLLKNYKGEIVCYPEPTNPK